jgi:hypothetical protein
MRGSFGRRLVQLMTMVWVLFLAFWMSIIQFNKYGDLSIIDCDRDGEAFFVLLCYLMGLTMGLIWIGNLILHYGFKRKPLWFSGLFTTLIAIAFIPKVIEWIHYNAALPDICLKSR